MLAPKQRSNFALSSCLILVWLFSSCHSLSRLSNQLIPEEIHTLKINDAKQTVFVQIKSDSIYAFKKNNTSTENASFSLLDPLIFPPFTSNKNTYSAIFYRYSLDLDAVTIPIKMRYSKDIPMQMNANINGAIYLGLRRDRYKINYELSPIHIYNRSKKHFGLSVGVFSGIGNTLVSPSNTNNQVSIEYDGVIWSKGIATMFAMNNTTIGCAFGFDQLLGPHQNDWIYQNKPYLGLMLGLNIN